MPACAAAAGLASARPGSSSDCGSDCAAQLEADGHRCTSIHGDLDHEARDRVVSEFRSGTTKILIATDVLSRGFDVTQVRRPVGSRACLIWGSGLMAHSFRA